MNVNCCTNVKLTRLLYKMIFCDWIIINDLLGHQHEAQGLFSLSKLNTATLIYSLNIPVMCLAGFVSYEQCKLNYDSFGDLQLGNL